VGLRLILIDSFSSTFSVPNGMVIFRRGPPNGAPNARGMKKSRSSTNIGVYLKAVAR